MYLNLDELYSKTVTESSKFRLHLYINLLNKNELEVFKSNIELHKRCNDKITNNAVRLCLKIYEDTGIKVFPFIQKCTQKGFSTIDGTFTWCMQRLDSTGNISSYSLAKECIKKKVKLKAYQLDLCSPQTMVDIDGGGI